MSFKKKMKKATALAIIDLLRWCVAGLDDGENQDEPAPPMPVDLEPEDDEFEDGGG
jgi:hypothetical protein